MLIPRQKTPDLSLPLLGGGTFTLSEAKPERGTLICFYRGYHCPICATYLKELDRLAPDFAKRGVEVIAVSSDTEERAQMMADTVKPQHLRFAHSLPLSEARDWGLYISTGRGKTSIGVEEPAMFAEPGVFLVDKAQVLYFASIQTMPFNRPRFADFIGALDFVIEKDYPARGEYAGAV
jgi:peroxiredoxin